MTDFIVPAEWQNTPVYGFFDTKKAEKIHTVSNARATIIVYTIRFTDENRLFLERILQAANLQIDTHIDILQFDNEANIDFADYAHTHDKQPVWWLGVSPAAAGWNVVWQPYKIYTVGAQKHFFSHDLDTIAAKGDLKRLLWLTIQTLFL